MKSNKVKGLFITGTDTGVGKTHVTQQILRQLQSQSISCVGMKPIASGAVKTANGLRNDDALKLQQASSVDVPYELINPYCFELAIAPHLAAQQSGVEIVSDVILDAYQTLSSQVDVVIVEGVGGWEVPLNIQIEHPLCIPSLAEQLQLPIVLVVGLRVGCINHAQLSHRSIYNGQCPMVGWVANNLEKDLLFAPEQIRFLQDTLPSQMLANLPWFEASLENGIQSGCESDIQSGKNINNDSVFDLDHLLLKS